MDKTLADMLKRRKKKRGSTNTALSIMADWNVQMVKYSTSIIRNTAALKEQGKSLYIDMKALQDVLLMKIVMFRMTGTVSCPCIKNKK